MKYNIKWSKYVLPGRIILKRNGKIVWWGHIVDPWEDVECDSVEVNRLDYEKLKLCKDGGQGGTCKS